MFMKMPKELFIQNDLLHYIDSFISLAKYLSNTLKWSVYAECLSLYGFHLMEVEKTHIYRQMSKIVWNKISLLFQVWAPRWAPKSCMSRERTWSGAYLGFRHSAASLFLSSLGCFPSYQQYGTDSSPNLLSQRHSNFHTILTAVDSLLLERVLPFRCSFFSHYLFIPPTGGVHVAADEHSVREVAYSRGHSRN